MLTAAYVAGTVIKLTSKVRTLKLGEMRPLSKDHPASEERNWPSCPGRHPQCSCIPPSGQSFGSGWALTFLDPWSPLSLGESQDSLLGFGLVWLSKGSILSLSWASLDYTRTCTRTHTHTHTHTDTRAHTHSLPMTTFSHEKAASHAKQCPRCSLL